MHHQIKHKIPSPCSEMKIKAALQAPCEVILMAFPVIQLMAFYRHCYERQNYLQSSAIGSAHCFVQLVLKLWFLGLTVTITPIHNGHTLNTNERKAITFMRVYEAINRRKWTKSMHIHLLRLVFRSLMLSEFCCSMFKPYLHQTKWQLNADLAKYSL